MIDENEIIHKLHAQGMSISAIADVTNIADNVIRTVLNETQSPLPDEEELRERSLRLANEALNEAFKIIRMGPASHRISLIRALVGNASKTLGKDSASDMVDLRLALERLMSNNQPSLPAPVKVTNTNDNSH